MHEEEVKKITETIEDKKIREVVEKGIQSLIDKIQFPDNFCKKCGQQMFYNGAQFVCKNCGVQAPDTPPPPPTPPQPDPTPQAPPPQPDAKQSEIESALGANVRMSKNRMPKR